MYHYHNRVRPAVMDSRQSRLLNWEIVKHLVLPILRTGCLTTQSFSSGLVSKISRQKDLENPRRVRRSHRLPSTSDKSPLDQHYTYTCAGLLDRRRSLHLLHIVIAIKPICFSTGIHTAIGLSAPLFFLFTYFPCFPQTPLPPLLHARSQISHSSFPRTKTVRPYLPRFSSSPI